MGEQAKPDPAAGDGMGRDYREELITSCSSTKRQAEGFGAIVMLLLAFALILLLYYAG